MKESIVAKALYERYIAPTKKKRQKFVGIEIEMPIINLNGDAVDFSVIHKLTGVFAEHFRMDASSVDDEGNICALQNNETGDILSYDCSYNNLEISLGKERDINKLQNRFNTYYSFIEGFLSNYNYTLTVLGINPFRKKNLCVPILNERYRVIGKTILYFMETATLLALITGILFRPRSWCTVCPMGTTSGNIRTFISILEKK